MSPALIDGQTERLSNARIRFDKVHVIWRANTAVGTMRRIEQRPGKPFKGMRWSLLTDRCRPKTEAAADAEALIAKATTLRTARARVYNGRSRRRGAHADHCRGHHAA